MKLEFITKLLRQLQTFVGLLLTYYKAIFLNYPYWRVVYPNGERTYKLCLAEANSLKKVFGGKLIICRQPNAPRNQGRRKDMTKPRDDDRPSVHAVVILPMCKESVEEQFRSELDELLKRWGAEIEAEDHYKHSIYTRCWNCLTWGINSHREYRCGNCGSENVSKYYPIDKTDA